MPLMSASQRWLIVLGVASVGLYVGVLAWAFENQSYNVWGSMLIAPLLVAINAVLIWRVGRREEDRWIVGLMGLGFVLKMLGSLARYFTLFVLYDGVGDATGSNNYAAVYYKLWRQGLLAYEPSGKVGTQNTEIITTAVYTVIGPAPLAGFLVFAAFAFWGCYLLYRAFRVALPEGQHRFYAGLVFLMPSLLFWPSSIGKEAWLMLWVGTMALGIAKFFQAESGAWPLLLLGAGGTLLVRPHITVLLVAGMLAAQTFRPVRGQAIGAVSKAFGVLILVGAMAILTTQSADFLGIDDLSSQTVMDQIDWASGQTQTGGSSFTPMPLSNPLGLPAAIITLLFRPFPWEASGPTMLLQSLEGLFLIWLCIRQRSRLRQLPRLMLTNPYFTVAAVYALAFIVAFAGFANFGILARQRTLMLPFFLVLLALPKRGESAPQMTTTASRASRAMAHT